MNISSVTRFACSCEDRHPDRREYVEVVGLSRQECLSVVVDRCELHAGRIDRFAL